MASQFDAVGRVSIDMSNFRSAANAVTKGGGDMSRVFKNLHSVMNTVDVVEKKLAADVSRTMRVYTQASTAASSYARAVKALSTSSTSAAAGAKLMVTAFNTLGPALSKINGLSAKEAARLTRTIALYAQMANVVKTLATAQSQMASITQKAQALDQAATREKNRAAEATRKLANDEQRLAIARQQLIDKTRALDQAQQKLVMQQQRLASQQQSTATSTARTGQAMNQQGSSAFALRSALGELEGAYQGLAQSLLAIPKAIAGAAISQEKAFAQVARVVGEADAAAVGLKASFQDIAENFPISFEEVALIGQLGAQIGVSASELDQFTRTVARFSLTTGIAAEESTLLLGRIAEMQEVPIAEMENLGSAILALGTASAATDREILRVNESIATVSNVFGLTTQATAGLAAALATLRVRPELARGSLTRVFGKIDQAVEGGTESLKKFASIMGMTVEEVVNLRRSDPDGFLLKFVKGLQNSSKATGSFQQTLRDLGINAVRDIDTFTRLGNNFNVLEGAIKMANVEYAKGSELQRQSKGIFETTAASVQNLVDAFQNFLANAGGPLLETIDSWASGISDVLEWLNQLGPVVPILGAVFAAVALGAAVWATLQVVMAKAAQGIIAMRELKANLGVATINLTTVMGVYRNTLGQTTAATGAQAQANRVLATSTTAAATAAGTAATAAGVQTAAQRAAAVSTGLAAASQATMVSSLRTTLGAQAAATAAAARAATVNRVAAISTTQSAGSSRVLATQLGATGIAANNLNRTTMTLFANNTNLAGSLQRAGVAGSFMGSGMFSATTATAQLNAQLYRSTGATLATTNGLNAVTGAATRASFAMRAASFAMGPWGIAIGILSIALIPLISNLINFKSRSEEISDAAYEAAGGTQALTNAIKTDTDAVAGGAASYGKYSVAVSDLSDKSREAAERTREEARARIAAIEATVDSVAELRKQAKQHGEAGKAAEAYVLEIDDAEKAIKRVDNALKTNTAYLGEQARAFVEATGQAALNKSGILENESALKQLESTGINLGDILKESLGGKKGSDSAIRQLEDAHKDLQATIADGTRVSGGKGGGTYLTPLAKDAQLADNVILAFTDNLRKNAGEIQRTEIANRLLASVLGETEEAAAAVGGEIVITADNLEDMGDTAEEVQERVDSLAKAFAGFGTPLTAFEEAAKKVAGGVGEAADAVENFSLKGKAGLDAYIKELESVAQAQRDWAKNLAIVSATLGSDIAQSFEAEGPKAAKAVEEIAGLTTEELKKLRPRIEAITGNNVEGISATITKNSGKIAGKGKEIGDLFGSAVAVAMEQAVAPGGDITKASANLDTLATAIGSKTITPKIALDLTNFQNNAAKLETYVLGLVKSGKIDIKTGAQLITTLYTGKASELGGWVAAQNAMGAFDLNGDAVLDTQEWTAGVAQLEALASLVEEEQRLDAHGEGKLTPDEYKSRLAELEGLALLVAQSGALDAKGKAKLDPAVYERVLAILKGLKIGVETDGSISPEGTATLNPDPFNHGLGVLTERGRAWRQQLDKYLVPKPSVNQSRFNNDLANMRGNSASTGSTIQANLTRSATVTIGYTYKQNNSPPPTAQAADGGWIRGPGGPTSDRVPMMLSDGEFVVRAKQAEKFGALLESVNNDKYGKYGAYAGSGTSLMRDPELRRPDAKALSSSLIRSLPGKNQNPLSGVGGPGGSGVTINVTNHYPQAEPTSTTINRSLAYAATISGA